MADLYDVILFGINTEDSERDTTLHTIATILGIKETELRDIVDNHLPATIKQGVPIEVARKYHTAILRAGGTCNFRPSTSKKVKLELAPLELQRERSLFICPACEYKQEIPIEETAPTQCPQCGIIPSKYDKLAAAKEERERIKQRLLSMHNLREQQNKELAERKALEERQRRLEEEIRKELGLPKLINSRFRLFGSAAFIGILGMVLGGTAVALSYQSMLAGAAATQSAANSYNDNSDNAFDLPHNDASIPPQQDTLKQAFAFSHRRYPNQPIGSASLAGGNQPSQWDERDAPGNPPSINRPDESSPAPITPNNSKKARLDIKAIWQDIGHDGEWDLFLADQARIQVDANQTAKAYQLANTITSPRLKVKALGYLAESFRKNNDVADGENLFNLMAAYINGLPNHSERVEAYGILALSLSRMGDGEKAQHYLEAAEKLALSLDSPVENADNLARVAAYQARIDKLAEADANFRRVNTLVHSFNDKAALLSGYVKLATSYEESGNRGIALAILNETLLATRDQLTEKTEKAKLLQEIAGAYIKLGDADSAMLVVSQLDSGIKDQAFYNLTCELAYADRLYDAMKGLDKIQSPEYKSRASALVSRLQHSHPDMGTLWVAMQEKALASIAQISNPQDQSIVRGEFARYLAHSGQNQASEEWARKALTSAQSIEISQDRDSAYAVLSANLARANQTKLADDTKKLISTPSLAANVDKEIGKITQVFNEM